MRKRSPFPAVAWIAPALAVLFQDVLVGASVLVLWLIWRLSPQPEGPPVIPMALSHQWMQVTAGLLYFHVTGRALPAIAESDYRPMIWIGLACVATLVLGVRIGFREYERRSAPRAGVVASGLTLRQLFVVYVVTLVANGALREFAWSLPGLTQGLIALMYVRFALIFLIIRRLGRPRFDGARIGLLLTLEVLVGFTGYFAGFREPLVMGAIALYEAFDRRNKKHWAAAALIASAILVAGFLWMAVRTDFRRELDTGEGLGSSASRLAYVGRLTTDFAQSGTSSYLDNLDGLVDRLWTVYYPSLAISRVPEFLPHENGALLLSAVRHVLMPRLLFPDKPGLVSDSQLVRKYSGIWVAGEEENTSIAFGYAAESYVDFGVPGMFVPVFVYALAMGVAYGYLLRLIRHRDLAVGLVTVVFWLGLYIFERSWAKSLGLSGTLMIYIGGIVFLLDRYLLVRSDTALRAVSAKRTLLQAGIGRRVDPTAPGAPRPAL